jgi:predicted RNA-binding protein
MKNNKVTSINNNKTSHATLHLVKNNDSVCPQKLSCIKGQLIPLSQSQILKYNTIYGLRTISGNVFAVHTTSNWKDVLAKHLWEYIALNGFINYQLKSITIHSVQANQQSFREQIYSLDDFSSDQVLAYKHRIKHLPIVA